MCGTCAVDDEFDDCHSRMTVHADVASPSSPGLKEYHCCQDSGVLMQAGCASVLLTGRPLPH